MNSGEFTHDVQSSLSDQTHVRSTYKYSSAYGTYKSKVYKGWTTFCAIKKRRGEILAALLDDKGVFATLAHWYEKPVNEQPLMIRLRTDGMFPNDSSLAR